MKKRRYITVDREGCDPKTGRPSAMVLPPIGKGWTRAALPRQEDMRWPKPSSGDLVWVRHCHPRALDARVIHRGAVTKASRVYIRVRCCLWRGERRFNLTDWMDSQSPEWYAIYPTREIAEETIAGEGMIFHEWID